MGSSDEWGVVGGEWWVTENAARDASTQNPSRPTRYRSFLVRRLPRLHDRVGSFRGVVREQHQVHVAGRDLALDEDAGLKPANEPRPVVAAEEDHGELIDLPRLDERERLEQLVQRAEAAGEDRSEERRVGKECRSRWARDCEHE